MTNFHLQINTKHNKQYVTQTSECDSKLSEKYIYRQCGEFLNMNNPFIPATYGEDVYFVPIHEITSIKVVIHE